MENLDLDLRDGGRSLLNLKFANDIIIIGTNYHLIGVLVGKLVEHPAVVGITAECAGNKSPHNAGPTTVAMANAEWIDHINSLPGIKPQVAFITNHTMYMWCWVSSASRGNINILIPSSLPSHVLKHVTELYTAMTYTIWMLHIGDFSGSGRASSRLDIAMEWRFSHMDWARSGIDLAGSIQIMVAVEDDNKSHSG